MIHLIPGDPAVAIAGLSATPEQIANIRHDLGLDQPLLTQLWRWYAGLLHGNLGRSLLLGQPVVHATMLRLPVTLALSAYALVITLLIGLVQRHRRGAAAEHLGGPGGDDVRDDRHLAAEFLSRPADDHLLRGRAALAADRRLRRVHRRSAGLARHLHHAGDLAGAAAGGTAGAHHALHHAGGAATGLHPHRARQGAAATAGGGEACAGQCADPDHHRDRHHRQPADLRFGGDRDAVLDSRASASC